MPVNNMNKEEQVELPGHSDPFKTIHYPLGYLSPNINL